MLTKEQYFQQLQQIARRHGGECFPQDYVDCKTKLPFVCAKGHRWEAFPQTIKGGAWCQQCRRDKRLADAQKTARAKGGKCLSTHYVNDAHPMEWQCARKHTWQATACRVVTAGGWCPVCAQRKPLTLEDMQRVALSKGGKCLSESYINSRTELTFQCQRGHIWTAKPTNVQNGSWCLQCYYEDKKRPMFKQSEIDRLNDSTQLKTFGDRLRFLRFKKQWQQQYLGEQVGLKRNTIVHLESSGETSKCVLQMAQVFGVNPYWLATGRGSQQRRFLNLTREEEMIVERYRTLSVSGQRSVTQFLANARKYSRPWTDLRRGG